MKTEEYLAGLIGRFNAEISYLLSSTYPDIMERLRIDPAANLNDVIKKLRSMDLIHWDISDELYLTLLIVRARFLTDWMVTCGMEYSIPSFQYNIDPDAWMNKEETK